MGFQEKHILLLEVSALGRGVQRKGQGEEPRCEPERIKAIAVLLSPLFLRTAFLPFTEPKGEGKKGIQIKQ